MQDIPTIQTSPRYRYRIELDDVAYTLRYAYNTRNDAWHLDIFDAEENPLHVSIKVVRNFDMILRDVGASFPDGAIYGVSYGSGSLGLDGLLTGDTVVRFFNAADVAYLDSLINPVVDVDVITFAAVP